MNISITRTTLLLLTTLVVTAAMVAFALAASPRLMSYQGRLTSSDGNPVADGTYSVTFKIYSSPSSGSPHWSETNNVTTTNGLFSVILGTVTPIPDMAVSDSGRYMALQLGANPEMTPRTHLTSVPFALNGGGWIDHGSSVGLANLGARVGIGTAAPADRLEVVGGTWDVANNEGDVRIGNASYRLKIGVATGGDQAGHSRLYSVGGIGTLTLGNDSGDVLTVRGPNVGIGTTSPTSVMGGRTLDISGGSLGSTLALKATSPGTNWELHSETITGGVPSLEFSAPGLMAQPMVLTSRPGDSSVLLANNAISANEIRDEPGIAVALAAEMIEVNCSNTPQDLDTVSLTIPTAGYIVVEGRCDGIVVTPNGAGGQIGGWICTVEDTASDQTPDDPHRAIFSFQMPVTSGSFIQFPATVSRTYYKPAGTYTFRLIGGFFGNCLDERHAYLENFRLQATFYPTSYGSVQAIVSSSEAGQFETVRTISIPSGPDRKGPGTPMYQVDLRDLELKAARAQAEADRLQRQLAEERLKQAQGGSGE